MTINATHDNIHQMFKCSVSLYIAVRRVAMPCVVSCVALIVVCRVDCRMSWLSNLNRQSKITRHLRARMSCVALDVVYRVLWVTHDTRLLNATQNKKHDIQRDTRHDKSVVLRFSHDKTFVRILSTTKLLFCCLAMAKILFCCLAKTKSLFCC